MRSLSSRACSLSPLPHAHSGRRTSARLPGWEAVLYFSGHVTEARCSIFFPVNRYCRLVYRILVRVVLG
jgi:hypothetical protein